MRRRRRFKGTWLPNIGVTQDTVTQAPTAGREMDISIAGGTVEPVGGVLPIIFDAPQEPNAFADDLPLSWFTGNEYSLRRIVGKCFIHSIGIPTTTSQAEFDATPPAALVTAGFFIARAGDESAGAGEDFELPIGWTTQGIHSYNPDNPDCIREPWIWRRQWIIANTVFVAEQWQNLTLFPSTNNPFLGFDQPTSNIQCGSVLDGPHIDAKCRRRVGNDDRLWFACFAQNYPRRTTGGYTHPNNLRVHLDYRVFGALRKARNRGNF